MTSKMKIKGKLYHRLCEICRSDIAFYKIKYKYIGIKHKLYVCEDCINKNGYKQLSDFILYKRG